MNNFEYRILEPHECIKLGDFIISHETRKVVSVGKIEEGGCEGFMVKDFPAQNLFLRRIESEGVKL